MTLLGRFRARSWFSQKAALFDPEAAGVDPAGVDVRGAGMPDEGDAAVCRRGAPHAGPRDEQRTPPSRHGAFPPVWLSAVNRLDAKSRESREAVLHGLERLGGVAPPLRDLARDP